MKVKVTLEVRKNSKISTTPFGYEQKQGINKNIQKDKHFAQELKQRFTDGDNGKQKLRILTKLHDGSLLLQ